MGRLTRSQVEDIHRLYYREHKSYEQIADELGISLKDVVKTLNPNY